MRTRSGISSIVFISALIMGLSGCEMIGVWSGRTSRIDFQVAGAGLSNARSIIATEIVPTHAAVMGLSESGGFLEYFDLGDDPVHAFVPKGEVYSIALFGPDLDGRLVSAGPVRFGTFDLDVLPVSQEGASIIDLGVLAGTADGFVSEVPDEEISDVLGYSTEVLRNLGAVDGQILRLLNPDANADALIDHEQGIEWGIFVTHQFGLTANATQLQIPAGTTREELLTPGAISMNFWTTEDFGRYFTEDQFAELAVDLPVTVWSDTEGGETSTLVPGFGGPGEDGSGYGPILAAGGAWGSGAWSGFDIGNDVDPDGPYVGDHVFHIGADEYVVDGMNFYRHGDGFDGVPFPVYSIVADEQDLVESVSWAWYWIEGGEAVAAPPGVVEILVTEFVVQFGHMPSHGGIAGLSYSRPPGWFEGGTLGGLNADAIDLNTYMLGFYTRDLFGNVISYDCPLTYIGPT